MLKQKFDKYVYQYCEIRFIQVDFVTSKQIYTLFDLRESKIAVRQCVKLIYQPSQQTP